jgi:hypothetical protein
VRLLLMTFIGVLPSPFVPQRIGVSGQVYSQTGRPVERAREGFASALTVREHATSRLIVAEHNGRGAVVASRPDGNERKFPIMLKERLRFPCAE